MGRAIVLALSVILALVMAVPVATAEKPAESAKKPAESANIGALTDNFWNWAFENPTSTSPLVGDYSGGEQCDGFEEGNETGVWFLAGEFALEGDVETGFVGEATRKCTIPAGEPILIPVVNALCGEAPTVQQDDGTFTGDPRPYTKCAKESLDQALADADPDAVPYYARVDGTPLPITRAASGLFTWEVPNEDNPQGLPPGSYESATEGLWVYLPDGLAPGNYTLEYGGSFFGGFFVLDITYKLKVE